MKQHADSCRRVLCCGCQQILPPLTRAVGVSLRCGGSRLRGSLLHHRAALLLLLRFAANRSAGSGCAECVCICVRAEASGADDGGAVVDGSAATRDDGDALLAVQCVQRFELCLRDPVRSTGDRDSSSPRVRCCSSRAPLCSREALTLPCHPLCASSPAPLLRAPASALDALRAADFSAPQAQQSKPMSAATSAASATSPAASLSRLSLQSIPSSSSAPLFPVAASQPYFAASSSSSASSGCSSLTDLCLQHYSAHLEELGSFNLQQLPETLVQDLLRMVLQQSRLTPRIVRLFAACGHESVVHWLRQNVQVEATIMIDATHSCRPTRY